MSFRLILAALAMLVAAPAAAQSTPDAPSPDATAQKAQPAAVPQAAAAPAQPAIDHENIWYLDLSTGGRVTILLRPSIAPKHVERIRTLTRRGFYDGQLFHRVIDGFMAQTGDPKGTGEGGSDLPNLEPEFNEAPHVRGTVSMARANELNSANSQFFIMFQPMLRLDRHYTAFGRVIDGMQWVDAIERGEPPANPSRILQASIGSDHKAPPVFAVAGKAADPLAAEAAKLLAPAEPAKPAAPKKK